jgi:HSP20 family molecular chaperone IbpA
MSTVNNNPSSSRNELAEQVRQQQLDKEKIQAEHEAEIARLKQAFSVETAAIQDRFESSVQSERLNNYENLRRVKKEAQNTEENLTSLKNQRIEQLKNDLNGSTYQLENDGQKAVQEVMKKNAMQLEQANKATQDAETFTRAHHKKSVETIVQDSNQKIGKIHEAKQQEVAFQGARHQEAVKQIQGHFDANTTGVRNQYQNELKKLQDTTQSDLTARRLQNAQLLSAYSSRQQDPFYQLVRFEHEFTDTGDQYKIRVHVPPHERDKFKVQIAGQELQISGTRSVNEKSEIRPGNWVSTSSYQNFTERMPLPMPVDAKTLSKVENGDYLEYSVTKYGPHHTQGALAQSQAEDSRRDRVTQPDFPNELPKPSIRPTLRNPSIS